VVLNLSGGVLFEFDEPGHSFAKGVPYHSPMVEFSCV